jgi:hypothetical protein
MNVPDIVGDCSHSASEEETNWGETFLQDAIDTTMVAKDASDESKSILVIVKGAIQHAKEENGQVPGAHIDYVTTRWWHISKVKVVRRVGGNLAVLDGAEKEKRDGHTRDKYTHALKIYLKYENCKHCGL